MNACLYHADRPARARRLCEACYHKMRSQGRLDSFPKVYQGTSARRDYWREYKRRKAAEQREATDAR